MGSESLFSGSESKSSSFEEKGSDDKVWELSCVKTNLKRPAETKNEGIKKAKVENAEKDDGEVTKKGKAEKHNGKIKKGRYSALCLEAKLKWFTFQGTCEVCITGPKRPRRKCFRNLISLSVK